MGRLVQRILVLGVIGMVPGLGLAQDPEARDDYNFAAGLHDRGLHDRAARAFSAFLEKWPGDSRVGKAHFYLGESLLAGDQAEAALPHFQTSAQGDHDRAPEARLRTGELLHRQGRHREALPYLEGVVRGKREDLKPAATYLLGETRVANGDAVGGRAALESLLKEQPDSPYGPFARLALGFLLMENGETDAALSMFRAVAQQEGLGDTAVEARLMVGECHLAQNDPTKALEASRPVPEGRFAGGFYLVRLRSFLALKKIPEAAKVYAQFCAAAPEDPRGHQALIRAAADLHRAGQSEDGLRLIQCVQGASGQEAQDAAYWSGLLLTKTGSVDDAVKRLREAVAQDPSPQRKFGLADALSRSGQLEEASALFAEVSRESQDETVVAEARFGEAYARNRLSDHAGAVKILERLQKSRLKEDLAADVRFALAENLFSLERHGDASTHYQTLLQNESLPTERKEACRYKLAWCQYLLGQHETALKAFREFLEQHPKSGLVAEGLYVLGKCQEALGQTEEARRTFQGLASSKDSDLAVRALLGDAAAAHKSRDLKGAAAAYRKAKNQTSGGNTPGEAWFGLINVLADSQQHEEVIAEAQQFLQAASDHPRSRDVRLLLGWSLRSLGRNAEALTVAQGLAEDPDPTRRGEALWVAALAAADENRWQEVVPRTETLLGQKPPHPRTAEAQLLHGVALARIRRPKDAIRAFEPIIGSPPARPERPTALYESAFAHDALQDIAARDRNFRRLVDEHPDSPLAPDARFRLAESAYAQKQWESALKDYGALLKSEAGASLRDKALYKTGWAEKQRGGAQEARAAFAQVADLTSPLAAESCYLAGDLSVELGDHEAAAAWFERMGKKHKDHELAPEARQRWILALAATSQWEDVLREGPGALSGDEQAPLALAIRSAMGDAFASRKAYERARAAYGPVARGSDGPLGARAQHQIALTFEQEGAADRAIDEYLKVGILYSHPEWVAPATLRAAELLQKSPQGSKAQKLLEDLMREHPDRPEAKKARALLEEGKRNR